MPHILIVSVTAWEGDYLKSTVELSKELAARNEVYFLDFQYSLKDLLAAVLGRAPHVPWKRMTGLSPRLRKVDLSNGSHVNIYTPRPIIPSFWVGSYRMFSFLNRINQRIVLKPLARLLRKRGAEPHAIVSALNPFMGLGVKRYFPDSSHAYYCFDEIRAAHWLRTFGGEAEDRLFPRLDGAVFTSDHLEREKGGPIKKTAVVKNGVHYEAFARHRRKIQAKKRPRVGYLGSIDDRFALDMMEEVVKKLDDYDFHLVGRVVDPRVKKRLEPYDNVSFFPPVAAGKVAPIMGQMDVGIIPYVRNEFTVAVYPLKVNEYLSVGLPVVMTPFADLPDFHGLADVADSAEAFAEAIRRNAGQDNEERIRERMDFASANSWTQRSKDLEQFIFSL